MRVRKVVRSDSAERAELEAHGWQIVARSWGACLDTETIDTARLQSLVANTRADVAIRKLANADSAAILALDALTLEHYPGDVATSHAPLTIENAIVASDHRGWGAFAPTGDLVAMTFLFSQPEATETDFTVVHPAWRGNGISSAVKAASILGLVAEGHRKFRTGGSAENKAIIAANRTIGYVIDEEWLTFANPGDGNV